MSTLIVKVQKIDHIEKHPNADTLSILQIGGWNVVAKTEAVEGQTEVVYVPIDAIAEKDHPLLGFLEGRRVKTIKLRGVISQGLCLPIPEVAEYLKSVKNIPLLDVWHMLQSENDINLQEMLEIKKYIPPLPSENRDFLGGPSAQENPNFHRYTNIEHYAHYVNAIKDEKVWVSEKLHGTSSRFGIENGKFLVGSRNRQLKYPLDEGQTITSTYIKVFERENIGQKLLQLQNEFPENKIISVYGEIVGPGIQGKMFKYGQDEPSFFLYDIKIDEKYLDYSDFLRLSTKYEIKTVPILAENISSEEAISMVDGKSTLDNHIREGIVIKPMKEAFHRRLGRVALKIVSKEYLLKDYEDYVND